jgi:hypothetical protein
MQSSILPKDHRALGNAIRLNNDTRMEALRAPSFAAGASWKRKQLEIILCAGATGSPQILMFSGVGRSIALSQLGISLVADPPGVGLYRTISRGRHLRMQAAGLRFIVEIEMRKRLPCGVLHDEVVHGGGKRRVAGGQ